MEPWNTQTNHAEEYAHVRIPVSFNYTATFVVSRFIWDLDFSSFFFFNSLSLVQSHVFFYYYYCYVNWFILFFCLDFLFEFFIRYPRADLVLRLALVAKRSTMSDIDWFFCFFFIFIVFFLEDNVSE